MKHHRVEQVGDHAGVVRDDEELLADLRPGAGAGCEIDHPVFFREAGDPRLGIADDQAVIAEALKVRGQGFRTGIDDGAVGRFAGEMTMQMADYAAAGLLIVCLS
ncbi:UNVERIFIED_ORG: hypothetical protein GGE63_000933 [Rhizobium esperanzae]